MRQSIRLSTLRRDHGPVIYMHDADVLQIQCAMSEGNFAGVKGNMAVIGVQSAITLIWESPLPKSLKTITNLSA